MTKKPDKMTSGEVCEALRITLRTLYRWGEAGKVHPVKAGRILLYDRAEIEALMTAAYEEKPKPAPVWGPVRYPHLKDEAKARGVTYGEIAQVISQPSTYVREAVEGGPRDLTVYEAIEVQRQLFPAFTLEYLFASPEESMSVNRQ